MFEEEVVYLSALMQHTDREDLSVTRCTTNFLSSSSLLDTWPSVSLEVRRWEVVVKWERESGVWGRQRKWTTVPIHSMLLLVIHQYLQSSVLSTYSTRSLIHSLYTLNTPSLMKMTSLQTLACLFISYFWWHLAPSQGESFECIRFYYFILLSSLLLLSSGQSFALAVFALKLCLWLFLFSLFRILVPKRSLSWKTAEMVSFAFRLI